MGIRRFALLEKRPVSIKPPAWPLTDRDWANQHTADCPNGKCNQTRACIEEQHREIAARHIPSPPLAPDAPTRTIIAFTGLAGAGKTTAAAHLVVRRGFKRVRFAGPLKAMMAALGLSHAEIEGDRKELPCELLGGKTPRWAMQSLGTEWGRNLIASDLWIRAWQKAVADVPAGVPVVVDDCRFPNEAQAVQDAGGIIVRIERPGVVKEGYQHSSETHVLPAARTLHNTLSDRNLREQVDVLLRDLSWVDQ